MRLIADLHIHSRYSRATSSEMIPPTIARWAEIKGIDLVGTGDFTHPDWMASLEDTLRPDGDGVYRLGRTRFLLTAEVAAIWKQEGRTRRVHLLLLAPSFAAARRIGRGLAMIGRLTSDGRPMLGASAVQISETVWEAAPDAVIVPAHVWTPWYSMFGAESGFDSIEACFGPYAERIFAVETGLSSDPPMNRRVSALDRMRLVSCSDAHSPSRLGREATLFDLRDVTYSALVRSLHVGEGYVGTIEFYPQEGKYHYDGHRGCRFSCAPRETLAVSHRCPVCNRRLTVGVLHRIEELADREEHDPATARDRYWSVVPLDEIIAQAFGVGANTKTVFRVYEAMTGLFGNEFSILLDRDLGELTGGAPGRVVEGIAKVRTGDVHIEPGYDGVYGRVAIPFSDSDEPPRLALFS
jgi:DNA helicase-2/ATP-dependent DNA helicase PcrA